MARFYGSVSGSAGSDATRQGTPQSGITGHVRGWDVGIGVKGTDRGGMDSFSAYATTGSNGSGRGVEVFHVHNDGVLRIVTLDDGFGGGTFVIDGNGTVTRLDAELASAE